VSLADDLLEQAEHLARRDPTRPKQASLRRAISSAYYALFHLLIREAAEALVSDARLRQLVPRAFDHGEMKQACRPFAAGALPDHLKAITDATVPDDLRTVAETFAHLQQHRHEADYNVARTFSRSDALDLLARVRGAFEAWGRVRAQQIATVFLVNLLLAKKWAR
jgi:uncharacterized protein (UPF0332 family)